MPLNEGNYGITIAPAEQPICRKKAKGYYCSSGAVYYITEWPNNSKCHGWCITNS